MTRIPILLLLVLTLATAARSQRIDPARPDLSPESFRMDSLPESELNIPIRVSLKPLFSSAEKSVDTVFTSGGYPDEWVQEGCDIRYKYRFRRSPLKLEGVGNTLSLGFTGFYQIVGSTRVCVSGTVLSPWSPACRCGFSEPERRVNVSFLSAFGLDPDYKMRLYIKRNEPQPLDKCEVCFWGQDITKQVMKGLTTELDAAKKELEKTYGITDLRPRIRQVWEQLSRPYSLYGLGWLQIQPQRFRINQLFIRKDTLHLALGLSAKPVIRFEIPPTTETPLPELGSASVRKGFSVFLDAILSYDSLGRIMNQQLKGETYDLKKGFVKKKFILDSCQVYGGGNDKLILRIHFSGSNKGIFYLVGRPVYDTATRMLLVHDIDFDIKSRNLLLGSADWLFDKRITREITALARFDLGPYLDSAHLHLNRELNRELQKGVRCQGSIQTLTIAGIFPQQQHLVIRTRCEGALSIRMDSIGFSL
ncbi:MAG: hypothetical protein RJA57_306 [Bacteroidota bacterium]|jgi:hypothetical protein